MFLVLLASVVTIGAIARPASGQVWVDERDLNGKLPSWVDPAYVRPSPVLEPSYRRVWVEPVYRVICRPIWVEPVVRVEWVRVWVPPRYEWRETICWEGNVKVIRREHVCVEPGHWETQRREVVVTPGCWRQTEQRELVGGGYWKLAAD
jgi:hypothetical protein